jgi:hypothetical protein
MFGSMKITTQNETRNLCEAESVITRHGDRSALPLPVKCLGQYYCNCVWQTTGLTMAGCRRLTLHWNDAETSSERVNSAQLHQPSSFLHAPTWRHQIEDLGKDGRIILKCSLKYDGRVWAGMFWYKLGITSGILSTWRWEEAGLTISKRFLIRLVICFYYKECSIHLGASYHDTSRTFQTLPQCELTPPSFTATGHSCIQGNHYTDKTTPSATLQISSESVRINGDFADKLS